MYVKRHAVVKDGRRYVYLRLVEAYRDADGRVRHRVLRTLGREDELKASGQLEQLAASFARLDPPPVGTRRHVGPLLLVAHYLRRLGLVDLVDDAVPMRGRAMLTHGEVIAALVANRLCAPAPLYDVAGWASSAAMAELFGVPAGLLNDDRLGRALEALAPAAEQVRGALALAAASRCGADLSRLHLDMTAVRFTGGYTGSALVAKGWAADRTIARQVKTMQVSTRAGVAVYYRPHPGGSNEAPCFADALEHIRELAPPGVVCVIDSGFGHLSKLCAADATGLRFVVPLRADTGWAGWFAADVPDGLTALARLDHCSQRERRWPVDQRTVWKGVLRGRDIADDDTGATHRLRIAYIWSSEQATSVADARERALTTAEDALGRIRNGLGGRYYKTRKQVDDRVAKIIGHRIADLITVTTGVDGQGKPTIAWHRNPHAITSASAHDGLYALATNLPDPPGRTLTALDVLRSTKTNGSSNNVTATSNKPCTCDRSSCTTTTASTRSSPSSASPCSSTASSKPTCAPRSAPTPHYPACCPNTATPSPPPVPCSPLSPTCTPPTPAPGSSSTGSPPLNDASSPTSTSRSHGPKHTAPQQHPKSQTLTPNYAENRPRVRFLT